jgi:hypothetical protein
MPMLPKIRTTAKIEKGAQIVFGGYDRRPDARDGTFCRTDNMTQAAYPTIAARPKRGIVSHSGVQSCYVIGFGDVLLTYKDGYIYYNGWLLCASEEQMNGRPVKFGNRLILPDTREIINLEYPLLGRKDSEAELPNGPNGQPAGTAAEGDAWVVAPDSEHPNDSPRIFVRRDGAWEDAGPVLQSMEQEIECAVIFRTGIYFGEKAVNNTIEINPEEFYYAEAEGRAAPSFSGRFQPGDAVTIQSYAEPEFNRTLIVREVTDTELRFYEYSFPYVIGRYTVLPVDDDGHAPTIGAGLYEVTGWDRFEREISDPEQKKRYFVIPSGTTLTAGMCIEYRYQDTHFNPAATSHNEAVIKVYNSDGTEVSITITPISEYNEQTYPDGPERLFFETIDTGEDLYFGDLACRITKKWPEKLEGVFEDSNRLWGWEGRTLRASKLGDPSNWNYFDGTADDAWAVELHRPGAITGGISVHGYPTFFQEDRRIRIYGDTPESFQTSELDCNGVREGCAASMCILDGALFYVSRVGVMQDSGSVPVCISEAFGPLRLREAVAGAAGTIYRLSGADEDGATHSFVLDTRNGVWIRESGEAYTSFAVVSGRLYGCYYNAELDEYVFALLDGPRQGLSLQSEQAPPSVLETNDYIMERTGSRQANRKRVHRVQLRMTVEEGAVVTAAIRYDGAGNWITVAQLSGDGARKSVYLPVLPRRCDHFRLRFTGSGAWGLESLTLEYRTGSAIF